MRSVQVPSLEPATVAATLAAAQRDDRAGRWRVVVPLVLGVGAFIAAWLPAPYPLHLVLGRDGPGFAIGVSFFAVLSTFFVAWQTARVRPLQRFERAIVALIWGFLVVGAALAGIGMYFVHLGL